MVPEPYDTYARISVNTPPQEQERTKEPYMPFGLNDVVQGVKEGIKRLDAIGTRRIGFGKGQGREKRRRRL